MSDLGLYGTCAAMALGALMVILVLGKWLMHAKPGVANFGLLFVGLVFLTIGVWNSLELTLPHNIKVITNRNSEPPPPVIGNKKPEPADIGKDIGKGNDDTDRLQRDSDNGPKLPLTPFVSLSCPYRQPWLLQPSAKFTV